MKYLCLDFFIGIVCTIFEKDSYFLELNIIFLIVVIVEIIMNVSPKKKTGEEQED